MRPFTLAAPDADHLGFLIADASGHSIPAAMVAVMARFAVTPTQFAALAKLDDLGSVSQNQLGRLTRMDPATISGVVGRLIARGYVRQSADIKDARLVMLMLTPVGQTAVTAMKGTAAEVSRRAVLLPVTALPWHAISFGNRPGHRSTPLSAGRLRMHPAY